MSLVRPPYTVTIDGKEVAMITDMQMGYADGKLSATLYLLADKKTLADIWPDWVVEDRFQIDKSLGKRAWSVDITAHEGERITLTHAVVKSCVFDFKINDVRTVKLELEGKTIDVHDLNKS